MANVRGILPTSPVNLHWRLVVRYDPTMGKLEQLGFDQPASIEDDEDKKTLAAIDEGIRDAEAGRTATPEQARRLLSKWITESSTLKGR
jgi:hypothetical protein